MSCDSGVASRWSRWRRLKRIDGHKLEVKSSLVWSGHWFNWFFVLSICTRQMAVLNCLSGSGMARRSGINSPFHGFAQTRALCGASAHRNQNGKKQIKTKRGRRGSPLLRIRPTQRFSCGVSQKNAKVRGEAPILQGRERQGREGAIKLLETGWPSHPASQYTAAP